MPQLSPGDAMNQMTNEFIEVNGLNLHYYRAGRTDRPAVGAARTVVVQVQPVDFDKSIGHLVHSIPR